MRVSTLSLLTVFVITLTSGCSSLQVQTSALRSGHGWFTEGQSAQRTNSITTSLMPPLELKWSLNAGGGFGSVSPLIVNDLIFVANRKGEVHATAIATGRRMGQSTFGESIEGTPLYEDGILYVPVGWGRSSLVAHDLLRGASRWKVKGAPISSGVLTYADVVIAADDDGVVRAYNKADGEVEWTVSLGEGVGVKASPVVAAGHVIVVDDRGRVSALNAVDGSVAWAVDLGVPVLSTPAANEESIFIATSRGRFVSLRAEDGFASWSYTAPNSEVYFASPAVAGELVVFGASDGVVRALDTFSGREIWAHAGDAAITAPPLLTEDVVYVGTMNSMLVALDRRSGSSVWTYELDGRIKSAFASKDNTLVVLAEPRTIYLFESMTDSFTTRND